MDPSRLLLAVLADPAERTKLDGRGEAAIRN